MENRDWLVNGKVVCQGQTEGKTSTIIHQKINQNQSDEQSQPAKNVTHSDKYLFVVTTVELTPFDLPTIIQCNSLQEAINQLRRWLNQNESNHQEVNSIIRQISKSSTEFASLEKDFDSCEIVSGGDSLFLYSETYDLAGVGVYIQPTRMFK